MPLAQNVIDEHRAQALALKRKLQICSSEIMAIKSVGVQATENSALYALFLAKLSRAHENLEEFIKAWDRLILIHIRLEDEAVFPSVQEEELRRTTLEAFDQTKAIEINLKVEPPCPRQETTSHHEATFSSKTFLDRLQLPYFDGNVKFWVRYRDVFSSLIHNDPSLSPVAKLHLLISSLSGEALSVVNRFDVTDASYPLAWEALNKAYDNERVLATSFLDQILDFKLPSNPKLHDLQLFLSQVADSISAFKALKLQRADDKILSLITLRTLDPQTRHRFEIANVGNEFPTIDTIISFIRNQCQALKLSGQTEPSWSNRGRQPTSGRSPTARSPFRTSPRYNSKTFAAVANSSSPASGSSNRQTFNRSTPSKRPQYSSPRRNENNRETKDRTPARCAFCPEEHLTSRCPAFIGLAIEDRLKFAAQWKGCHNCLNPEHTTKDCESRWSCRICRERHHTLLHASARDKAPCEPDTPGPSRVLCGHTDQADNPETSTVILGTACASARDSSGTPHSVRLLLDCGSQQSFVSQRCVERLHLKKRNRSTQVTGLGGSPVATAHESTSLILTSRYGDSQIKMSASILPRITSPLPRQPIPPAIFCRLQHLNLADPKFHKPGEVDILLGADYYDRVVTGVFNKSNPDLPATLPTIFGMVVMGSCKLFSLATCHSLLCQESEDLSAQLKAFWELEEPKTPVLRSSPEDDRCEDHFKKTHSRDPSGRYIVRLPFLEDDQTLGSNRALAAKRFFSLESKLASNPQFREDYEHFMSEYEELGHMAIAPQPSSYVIPHFGIHQNKLRVVFDASSPSSTVSLNSMLPPGPKLQADISDVLTQFRIFPIAITSDLVKMYRQVLLHPEDRQFQHIFWRKTSHEKLLEYELNTVTYGLTPSAFLAIRSVVQLMHDEGSKFPLAIRRLRKGMYVDDIVSGAYDEEEAQRLCQEIIQFFSLGGFSLSKWSSSKPSLLPASCERASAPLSLQPESSPETKVLGLLWNPTEDSFFYAIKNLSAETFTKRSVLSFIARMYDPLGFLAPVIFTAKCFLQELWRNQLDWDEELPRHLATKWISFIEHWPDLSQVRVPRYLSSQHRVCNIVGFCDASTLGYAAVIYLQVEHSPDQAEAHLLKAKTKVAPSNFVSVARLELCGAHLLARLLSTINLSPEIQVSRKFLFSDSMVALAWINSPSHLLRVFEANRVAAISELAPDVEWRHVGTASNPADEASRGLQPAQINSSELWWHGPPFLKQPPTLWSLGALREAPSLQPSSFSALASPTIADSSWMLRFSSLKKLLRSTAFLLRFARRSPEPGNNSGPISAIELRHATSVCARVVQRHLLPNAASSPELASLSPFLDELGVLRVGGRLQHAPLYYPAKHPIIIPRSSHFAKLIIRDAHETYFHAGPSLTHALVRAQFWIPSAIRSIKSELRKCISCSRRRPTPQHAIMAPLPPSRFSQGRAFQQTGIDYAGPFTLRDSLRRKSALSKGYLCVFVCMSTKALHLEAVSALTTEAFLACLDRFIARRGKPRVIHSDNATNFIGASRYLKDLSTFLHSQSDSITAHLSSTGVEWTFIPPRSPHFGGLWEAGVKSVKSLLVSKIGSQAFTFEEFATILARVESLLNSRPLCPMNEDPNSLDVLTPGHFLIGAAPCFLYEESLEDLPANRLSRWQHVQQQVQHVWSRWRRDYLNTLQQRAKWKKSHQNLRVNDLVVMLEKTSPPGHWPLARVTQVHPGSDGTVRVVSIRTSTGSTFKRSIHYLARLPLPDSGS